MEQKIEWRQDELRDQMHAIVRILVAEQGTTPGQVWPQVLSILDVVVSINSLEPIPSQTGSAPAAWGKDYCRSC